MINNDKVKVAIEAALAGGKLIKGSINKDIDLWYKTSKRDIVTEIDINVEKVIYNRILQSFPQHSFLGEEGVVQESESYSGTLGNNEEANYLWIVDPIDGTTNFIHNFPFYCTSIALAKKGDIKIAVIYAPFLDELFVAVKGKGATLNSKPITVSNESLLSESLLSTSFPRTKDEFNSYLALNHEARNIRAPSSSALQLAYVAAGRLSGYWHSNLRVWDYAAGILLIQEAGGHVSDPSGGDIHLGTKGILGTNDLIHLQVLDALNQKSIKRK